VQILALFVKAIKVENRMRSMLAIFTRCRTARMMAVEESATRDWSRL
jgi:hypothetical protein